jgi:pimeloyl-ACP methyl ester carboxylesterase
MSSHRREIVWIHGLHGFFRGPEDFRALAGALEAAFIQPPSDPDSLNWSLDRDVDLDPSVRLRFVSWDLRSWLSSPDCKSLDDLVKRFLLVFYESHPSKSPRNSRSEHRERHIALGEGLGARVLMQILNNESRALNETLAKKVKRGRSTEPLWDRVILLSGHPGFSNEEEREKRRALEERWAERILREPLEKVREDWFKQPPFSTSPRLLEQLNSEARDWRGQMSPQRLAEVAQTFLLGRQIDMRPGLAEWRALEESLRVLWVAGERDRKFVSLLHELQDLQVMGEFWMCPDSGHAVFLDAPADLAEKIRSFLI